MTSLRNKLILIVPLIAIFCALYAQNARAEEVVGVPASYNINYGILNSGETRVQMNAQLYNPKQDVYISQYSIILSLPDATDVEAEDDRGKITPTVEKKDRQTKITVKFNDKVIGKEKPLNFKLSYTSLSIAQKSGLVWEINIPKAADYKDIRNYNVSLNIPNSLGPQIYASPEPVSVEKTLTQKIYKYDTQRLSKTGAILSFGPYQIYSFDLKYHLKNSNLFNGSVKIALPPSLLYEQQISYDQIYPAPNNVETDEDGNYIATYDLFAGSTILVNVKGKAKILNPTRDSSKSGVFSEIPPALKVYTIPQKYWETQDPKIVQLVKEVVGKITPQSNVAEVAEKLFDYTVANLTYDPNRVKPDLTRFGALKALENKDHAVCMEFADLLITLLRSSGIPSQLFEGYAYTKDRGNRPAIGDVLHSWVRLYLPRLGWVAVDPTWSNTTGGLDYFGHLDTNHFVFAVKGLNSETPYPAGAYKIAPDQVGDINVSVMSDVTDLDSQNIITSSTIYSSSFFDGKKNLDLEISNAGKQTIFSAKITPNPNIFPSNNKTIELGDVPPYGKITKNLPINKEPTLNSPIGRVSYMSFEGKVESENLPYKTGGKRESKNSSVATLSGIAIALLLYGSVVFLLRKRPDLLQ